MGAKSKNNISTNQKRTFYISLVMLLLASFFTLMYLIFVLINTSDSLIVLDDKQTEIVGGILFMLGAMFGVPIGKKWWHIVYEEKGRGAYLKVKKVKK